MNILKLHLAACLLLLTTPVFADSASVYFNGDILTMEGAKPQYVEAVVVKGKKIAYVGKLKDALNGAGANPVMHDLKGQTLLPGFIDAWGHFTLIAQNTLAVNLGYFSKNPPTTTQQLIDRLKAEAKPFNGWIIGAEYADAFLSYETTPQDIQNMREAVERKLISLDLIALPTYDVVDQLLASNKNYPFGIYTKGDGGFKVAGILVSTDGAPQLRLAYFSKPYADTSSLPKDWRGMAVITQDILDRYAKLAYEKNIQYYGYSNGDAGIDMTLSAIAKAIRETGVSEDRRTAIAHSFFIRDDQLDQYKANKILPQFMPNHIWMYGDVYRKILGEDRAKNMVPLNSARVKGMQFGIHNDTPSSGPSALFTIWTAVNRKTYAGATLGPDQRIDPYLALRGFTAVAAYQYKEEASKGSITAGKLADLVLLDRNPLKVNPMEIKDIQIVKTIKHGKDLYVRP
jgi:predicted amidohydrolase YtcJ